MSKWAKSSWQKKRNLKLALQVISPSTGPTWVDVLLSCSWARDSLSTSDVVRVIKNDQPAISQPASAFEDSSSPSAASSHLNRKKSASINSFRYLYVASKEQNFWIILQNLQRLKNQWLVLRDKDCLCTNDICHFYPCLVPMNFSWKRLRSVSPEAACWLQLDGFFCLKNSSSGTRQATCAWVFGVASHKCLFSWNYIDGRC